MAASVQLYLIIGLLFGLLFIGRGYRIVEPAAKESSLRFRVLILPASVILRPFLFLKWLGKRGN
jgi:hypothetical protein